MRKQFVVSLAGALFLLLLGPMILFGQGKKWESIGPEGGTISALVQNPTNPDMLFAIPSGKPARLFQSVNHGASWKPINTLDESIIALSYHPHKPGTLVALSRTVQSNVPDPASGQLAYTCALQESKDGGKTWDVMYFPPIYSVYKVIHDPKSASTIHALASSTVSQGIVYLKSEDGGETWNNTVILNDNGSAPALAVDPKNPETIFVSVYPYSISQETTMLYKSTDGGKIFTPVNLKSNMVSIISDIAFDPNKPERVYAAMHSTIFRSTDGGGTWVKNTGSLSGAQKLWIDPKNSDHLYCTTYAGVIESNDGGQTWKVTKGKIPGRSTTTLLVESGAKPTMFTASAAGIFRSIDNGNTWKPSHKGIYATQVMSLRLAPSSPTVLFTGIMSNAVYKTQTANAIRVAWEQLPVFYTCVNINDMLIDEKDPNKILALEGGG